MLSDIKTRYRSEEYLVETENDADALKLIQDFPSMKQIDRNQLTFCESVLSAFDVLRFVSEQHIALLKFERVEPTLESLFMNIMDEAFKKYRLFYYEYHRHGLDEMVNNVANGRARIAKEMTVLKEAYNARPGTYIINTFLDAKSDELVNIFEQGTSEEKKQVYDLLMAIDPTRQTQYEKINK